MKVKTVKMGNAEVKYWWKNGNLMLEVADEDECEFQDWRKKVVDAAKQEDDEQFESLGNGLDVVLVMLLEFYEKKRSEEARMKEMVGEGYSSDGTAEFSLGWDGVDKNEGGE